MQSGCTAGGDTKLMPCRTGRQQISHWITPAPLAAHRREPEREAARDVRRNHNGGEVHGWKTPKRDAEVKGEEEWGQCQHRRRGGGFRT